MAPAPPHPPLPPPAKTQIAVQDDHALTDPATQDALLNQLARQKVKSIRANVIWGQVRTADGAYDFSKIDNLVNKARQRGIRTQLTVMGTPRYMPQGDQALSYKNADPKLLAQFSGDIAKHFRGRVNRYSVWNEPNIDAFLAGAGDDPRAAGRTYRGLYRAGYQGIKAADRGASVMLGEVTTNPNEGAFLKSVMAGKALKTAGMAVHPYDDPNNTPGGYDIDTLGPLQKLLGQLKRQGKLQTAQGSAAPLYLTEFGYQRGGKLTDAQRYARMHAAQRKAETAGARQMLYYQLLPTQRPPVDPGAAGDPGAPGVQDDYGNILDAGRAGSPGRAPGQQPWVWDTSVGRQDGQIGSLFADLARTGARARLARARSAQAHAARK